MQLEIWQPRPFPEKMEKLISDISETTDLINLKLGILAF